MHRAVAGERTPAPTVAERHGRALVLRARELRGQRSLSSIAALVGIRPDELGRIERGETRQVRWETLLGLAEAYGVGVGELLATISIERKVEPAYARALAAIRGRGAARSRIPRFAGDPDAVLAERDAVSRSDPGRAAEFAEEPATIRRSAFRPRPSR